MGSCELKAEPELKGLPRPLSGFFGLSSAIIVTRAWTGGAWVGHAERKLGRSDEPTKPLTAGVTKHRDSIVPFLRSGRRGATVREEFS